LVAATQSRDDGVGRGHLSRPIAKGRIQPEPARSTLESDVGEEPLWTERDQRLEAGDRPALPAATGAGLALPYVPAARLRLFNVALPELDRDSHGERVVSQWVEPDEQVGFQVHTDHDRR